VSAANISLRGRQFQVSRSQKIWFRSSTKLSKPKDMTRDRPE
jgi:hypothetical protein